MFKTGTTQQSYGLWDTELQAWMREATGNISMFGREQGESLCTVKKTLVLKEVFICSEEEFTDIRLPVIKQKWDQRMKESNLD